jgi:RNA polymerase sigma-70 factor (sigma-E family)
MGAMPRGPRSVTADTEFRAWAGHALTRLRRTAFLLCGDWDLADDLSQETLIRVYSSWGRIRDPGARDAYAATTLVNRHRSYFRRASRREIPRGHDDFPDTAAPSSHPPNDRVVAALAGLGPSQREIVVLRYWDDYSVADTARILGLSVGTVTSQSSRALATLRTVLAPSPDPASLTTSGEQP